MSQTLSKSEKTIADYLGDLIAVETHIEQALDHQLKLTQDDPTVGPVIQQFHDMVRDQLKELRALQPEEGTTAGNPVIAAGATILGKVAGIIDMVRTEAISKALRDDYTAFNLAAMSHSMFLATATTLGDTKAAEVAQRHLTNYAGAVQKINQIIAGVVINELAKDGHPVEAKVTADVTSTIDRAWRVTGPSH
jgi:ferritin-like metal-binding protein YciE